MLLKKVWKNLKFSRKNVDLTHNSKTVTKSKMAKVIQNSISSRTRDSADVKTLTHNDPAVSGSFIRGRYSLVAAKWVPDSMLLFSDLFAVSKSCQIFDVSIKITINGCFNSMLFRISSLNQIISCKTSFIKNFRRSKIRLSKQLYVPEKEKEVSSNSQSRKDEVLELPKVLLWSQSLTEKEDNVFSSP